MKFTFKKHPKETGLRAVGYPYASVDIKLNGKKIGIINAPSWQTKDQKWDVRFKIRKEVTKEEPCPWQWFVVKNRFDSEEQARQFVIDKTEDVLKLNLHVDA